MERNYNNMIFVDATGKEAADTDGYQFADFFDCLGRYLGTDVDGVGVAITVDGGVTYTPLTMGQVVVASAI